LGIDTGAYSRKRILLAIGQLECFVWNPSVERGAFMREGRYESGSNIGTAITFLLIGLGAGAVVGMLLAPKTGRQLRRDLRRGYENARETFDDWKETARDIAEEAIERGSDLADDLKDRVKPLARGIRRG
jgi:gas vesicle protein